MKKCILMITGLFLISLCFLLIAGCNQQQTSSAPPNVPIAQQMNFVGDSSTMIYHRPDCTLVPHEADVVPIDSPLSATRAGFKPCKKCKPPTE